MLSSKNNQSLELSLWSIDIRKEYWGHVLPYHNVKDYPKLCEVSLMWGFKLQSIPISESLGLGVSYAISMICESNDLVTGGNIRLNKSNKFVASLRLKKGDLVGITYSLKSPKDCKLWWNYVIKHSVIETNFNGKNKKFRELTKFNNSNLLNLGIHIENPMNFPGLRDYYEIYQPIGNPSQVTRNLVWSGFPMNATTLDIVKVIAMLSSSK
jgi:hypothetical protein